MAELSMLLPRISSAYRNEGDPFSLLIEGQSHLSARGLLTGRGSLDIERKRDSSEHRGKNKENIRAQTAGGRLSVDIIARIKEKLNNSHTYIQQMFRNNDSKGQLTISREALTRVLWNICGYLNTQQINTLLVRVNLSGQPSISFDDFKKCFQNNKVHTIEWLSPSSAKHLQRSTEKQKCIQENEVRKNNERAWNSLLEKVKKGDFFYKHLPSSCLHASGLVTAQQFMDALTCTGVILSDDEQTDIWARMGKPTNLAVPSTMLFSILGLPFPAGHSGNIHDGHLSRSVKTIIGAIKEKLNEACSSMLQEFSKINKLGTGLISRSAFRLVLTSFNVPMTGIDMEHLLARFNLRRKDGMVDFSTFVDKLKSRSYLSLMKRMLEEAEQRAKQNVGRPLTTNQERLSALDAEQKLFHLCQGLFIHLLAQFRKADVLGNGSVSCEDFRDIIEKAIQIQLTVEQVKTFAIILGDLDSNCLSYRKFLALIQDRPTTYELTEEIERLSSLIKVHHRVDKIRYRKNCEMDLSRYTNAQTPRNLQVLYAIVWDLLQNKFWHFCKVFLSICRNDNCTADKEKLDAVFLRMNMILLPQELESLWYSLPLTYPVESISLRKLLSYFVGMKKPKDTGPKKQNHIEKIQIKLAKDIIMCWNEMKSVMKSRDPHGTGQVSFTEICAVFQAMKLNVGPEEFDALCQAFDLNQDGKFNYITFLKFYVKKNKMFH
ncbi:EF-hand calcium-binding domain-containing protein 6-like [Pelodytes ibericus]